MLMSTEIQKLIKLPKALLVHFLTNEKRGLKELSHGKVLPFKLSDLLQQQLPRSHI